MTIDVLARTIRDGKPVVSLQIVDDRWPELNCEGVSFTDCTYTCGPTATSGSGGMNPDAFGIAR